LVQTETTYQSNRRETVAVYDDLKKTIFLPDTWKGETAADLSVLVHEMLAVSKTLMTDRWNEKLAVTWPHDMTMMQLMAALVPDRLVAHILAAIQDQTNAPLTPQEQQRLVQMRVEVEDLRYAEEQLVAAEGGR
jgi:hypothetical protein